ncbi:probable phosphoglycerate mutase [Desulforhopalus singaporensis]|uniref:Probable phosphoglycerate mutase n=1 Tax=Desulforhopalus singaporensis TaxID=91360 RepID=A0A1H0UAY9_9BACT|nr:probable phosphoglycerate mutase [Desulforhopalus singaporensis]
MGGGEGAWRAAQFSPKITKKPVEVIDDFKEICLGDWEGLTTREVNNRYPGCYEARGKNLDTYRPPGGESFIDLQQRVWPVFSDIAESGSRLAVIVAHAGVNRVILCRILGINVKKLFIVSQPYACVNIIDCNNGTYSLRATLVQPSDPFVKNM